MGDEKLKQELLYMVKLATKYNFEDLDVVESILRLENERQILNSVFGNRFKTRIFDIATGVENDGKCVICGQPADNHVICKHCIETINDSDYAKNKIKNKEKKPFDFSAIKTKLADFFKKKVHKKDSAVDKVKPAKNLNTSVEKSKPDIRRTVQMILIFGLSLILVFQIWILVLWVTLPEYNPIEEPKVSSFDTVKVSSVDEALAQLSKDFPEEEGYTLTFARMDDDFVGRFLLDRGDCCFEVEEALTDEECYDYYFTEDVYVIYISMNEKYSAKVGMAEINANGDILVMGSFNDGRITNSFYKYR